MIALASTTALLLNHTDGTARLVQYDGQLESLKGLLAVDYVDADLIDSRNVLFYDDEFHEKPYKTGFKITYKDKVHQFWGSGLITGDDAGTNAPLDLVFSDLKIEVIQL